MRPHPAAALLVLVVGLLAAVPAAAQRPEKIPRIGVLGMDSAMQASKIAAFRDGLRELGYREGRDVVIEYRWAEGRFDRLPELAAELVRIPVDIIVTAAPPAVRAASQATSTIPIVVAATHEPVSMGIVASWAHPGGNITGQAFQDSEFSAKRLELLRDVLPRVSRVAVVWESSGGGRLALSTVEAAARDLHIAVQTHEVHGAEDIARAIDAAHAGRAQAVLTLGSPVITTNRRTLLDRLAAHHLPAICEERLYVAEGCLMSYAARLDAMFHRAAYYVDRILKGAKPGDLPIEQPSTFDLAVNARTARNLGLTIPPSVLLRATEVIQ